MRVKHGLDHDPSTYGMEVVVRTVYTGVEGAEVVRMLKSRAGMPVPGSIWSYGD
jgi:hypothetical protein